LRRPALGGPRAWALAALLAAALLRALPIQQNRFHPDEALYASFGRWIASGRDVLLAQVLVDKPPLPFYLTALSFGLFGGNELAARLPTFFASLVSVALLFALARRWYGGPLAALAAWLLALSPFAILFSITVFIDPLLTMCGLWGLWMASTGRPRGAAVALALAFATKQTALLFWPLALTLSLGRLPSRATPRDGVDGLWRLLRPGLISLAVVTALMLAWDALRLAFGAEVSFWAQGYSDNMPNRLIRSGEVPIRAQAGLELLGYITAAPLVNWLSLIGLPLLLARPLRRPSRAAFADVALLGYVSLYCAGYWLLAFNIWDRYLIPILPLIVLLMARSLWHLVDGARHIVERLAIRGWGLGVIHLLPSAYCLLPPAFCLLLLPSAFTAARSGYPVGGDHGAYDGIDDTARFLQAQPYGAVLYDHWLSWQWNFYLFDGPVYVAWFPTPDALAADLSVFGRASPRFIVVPSWEADAELRAAAARPGFEFAPAHTSLRRDGSVSFVVYRLQPVP
jgi:4-amino-4-deoxy-L-arabinose transferase-like glycosyltransferase